MASRSKSVITVHVSKDIDPETLEALGQMMLKVEEMVMSEEFEKFKKAVKVIVNTPKEKTRKPKKKPSKKPKKKGG